MGKVGPRYACAGWPGLPKWNGERSAFASGLGLWTATEAAVDRVYLLIPPRKFLSDCRSSVGHFVHSLFFAAIHNVAG
ncbi:hypothetical protein B5X24_HaOG207103 [Helicoverpa armigera]|uniref:Uncharacterized protein n=1 Tax=Helicoverpa armigera TaxID=29058 RepID=A0A2W1BIF1_HELAM|nr:hypothetical protein B5X24_HaOG207103 [Helicoverpa armigera]